MKKLMAILAASDELGAVSGGIGGFCVGIGSAIEYDHDDKYLCMIVGFAR